MYTISIIFLSQDNIPKSKVLGPTAGMCNFFQVTGQIATLSMEPGAR